VQSQGPCSNWLWEEDGREKKTSPRFWGWKDFVLCSKMAALIHGFRRSLIASATVLRSTLPRAAACSLQQNKFHTQQWKAPQKSSLLLVQVRHRTLYPSFIVYHFFPFQFQCAEPEIRYYVFSTALLLSYESVILSNATYVLQICLLNAVLYPFSWSLFKFSSILM